MTFPTRRRQRRVGAEGRAAPGRIRVVQVPRRHVYVAHIRAVDGSDAVSHPRRDPAGPDAPSYPALRLDAGWIEENRDRFDAFHIHFGFDGHSPAQLESACAALRRHGKGLVYTVHDLRNPHHDDPGILDAQFDVLARNADRIITLTPGAAEEIRRRSGRAAAVVPHPHVVPLPDIADLRALRAPRKPYVLGLHLKSLRANFAAADALDALEAVIPGFAGDVRVVVDIHDEAYERDGGRFDRDLRLRLDRLADRRLIELKVHGFFSEAAFFEYLAGLDVSLLPYAFGTHSGWLEACRDLGTEVVVSDRGHYAEQGAHVHPFRAGRDTAVEPASLRGAIESALRSVGRRGDPVAERTAQRQRIAARHRAIYREAIAAAGGR